MASWIWFLVVIGGVIMFKLAMGYRSPATLAKAGELISNGAAVVDVRTPGEFASGHHPGAVNIPVGEIRHQLGQLGAKEKPVVLYCRSGSRSALASRVLKGAGFSNVIDLGPQRNTRDLPVAVQ